MGLTALDLDADRISDIAVSKLSLLTNITLRDHDKADTKAAEEAAKAKAAKAKS